MTPPSHDLALDAPLAATPTFDAARLPAHARWVLRLLQGFRDGTLDLTLPDGQRTRFGHSAPHAQMTLANWNVIGAALKSGDIGFAESYIAGDWASADPARVLQVFIRNRAAAEQVIYGSVWGTLLHRLTHLLNRNTRRQAKKNIHAHYDLGNDFYALWLCSRRRRSIRMRRPPSANSSPPSTPSTAACSPNCASRPAAACWKSAAAGAAWPRPPPAPATPSRG
jgi:hypothetical protein